MPSFAFNRLPVELQLMVWQHARASIGPQAITGDLDLSTTTLSIRAQNVARLKDYIRLFSICHNSRQEVLRNPPVLIVEDPSCRELDYPDPAYDAKPLSIKHWDFGRVFTDIAFDLCLLQWVPEPAEGERERTPELQSRPDFVRKALLDLCGRTIRRLHVYGGDIWVPISITPRRLSSATFCDSGALHIKVPEMGSTGLGEVARQDMNGVTSLNDMHVAEQLALSNDLNLRGDCDWSCDRRETLVNLVTGTGPDSPDLEYVSLLAWRNLNGSIVAQRIR